MFVNGNQSNFAKPAGQGILPIPKKSRIIKTDKPRPFLCPTCTRGFVRQEHLKRHQHSHTREKPYLCIFCGRCFARTGDPGRMTSASNSNSSFAPKRRHSVAADDPSDLHIIKIAGNKETILPTPKNLTGKTPEELKEAVVALVKSNNVELPGSAPIINDKQVKTPPSKAGSLGFKEFKLNAKGVPVHSASSDAVIDRAYTPSSMHKTKRHASFSASSAMTYMSNNNSPHHSITNFELIEDAPHQVGFSTPQMTAKQLMESVSELDLPPLTLDEPPQAIKFNLNLFNNGPSGQPQPQQNSTSSTIVNSNNGSTVATPGVYLLNSGPSLTDLLTMNSAHAGAGGYMSTHQSPFDLGCFSHDKPTASEFNLPSSFSHTMVSNSTTASNSYSNLANQTYREMSNEQPLLSLSPKNPPTTVSDSSSTVNFNSSTNNLLESSMKTNDRDSNIDPAAIDDKWLSEFINNSDPKSTFKINFNHFNDIGFIYSPPSSRSSIPNKSPPNQSGASLSPRLNLSLSGSTDLPVTPQNQLREPSYSDPISHSSHKRRRDSVMMDYDLSNFFSSRQLDISKVLTETEPNNSNMNDDILTLSFSNEADSTATQKQLPILTPSDLLSPFSVPSVPGVLFTDELRNMMLVDNNIDSEAFPTTSQLNGYVTYYREEFHPFFSFVHLPSIIPSMDSYPLLLSISMVGALYGFHSTHAKVLANVASTQIKKSLKASEKNPETTDLWVIQTLVLLTFYGIFNKNTTVIKGMHGQLTTIIRLLKSSRLNLPLESICQPPIKSDHMMEYENSPHMFSKIKEQYNAPDQMNKNYQYFVLAQSRIRTCHAVLLISNLFSSLVGDDCCFHSMDLKCGVPCYKEDLYQCRNAIEWSDLLSQYRITLDSKFSLIELSNGNETYENCLRFLSTGDSFFYGNAKVSLSTCLSLLISIHEKIFIERNNARISNDNNDSNNIELDDIEWKITSRQRIDTMLKYWENLYLKNGGILTPTENSMSIINANPAMRLIIPVYLFAKMRRCLDLAHVIEKIWLKDWSNMNKALEEVCYDMNSLREATEYALNLVDAWTSFFTYIKQGKRKIFNTPVFATTCMFTAILVISEYMKCVEDWARGYNANNPNSVLLDFSDRILWLKAERILRRLQMNLIPKECDVLKSYTDFLRWQDKDALDLSALNEEQAQRAMDPNTDINETIQLIVAASLSSKCLYLGVQILGDAPIWPIILSFAHALQSRAIYSRHMREEGQQKERTGVKMEDPDDNEAEATGLQQYSGETTRDGNEESMNDSFTLTSRHRGRSNTISSIVSGYEIMKEHMDKEKFIYLILASLLLYMGFVAAFAPRTSLSRDFRRFHSSRLTNAEVYRIYLNSLQQENRAKEHVYKYAGHMSNGLSDSSTFKYTLDEFLDMGYKPKVEKYYPWIGDPVDTNVALLENGKVVYQASMIEDKLKGDPVSHAKKRQKGFHQYSKNGNVTAQYVFCNYGSIGDYKLLLKKNIDIEDKIHIVRSGKIVSGLKVKNAELYGASSVIIYTDPFDDGKVTEKNGFLHYPYGPARNPSYIKRDSVNYFSDTPGDPTTPGYPSKDSDTEHMSPVGRVPRIPSVPMSARDVQPILKRLNGRGFQIGPGSNIKDFGSFTGPSSPIDKVHLHNELTYNIKEMSSIEVSIPGIFTEGEIIIGAHRDSLASSSAGDANSGSAILLEIARGMSKLLKHGWKPLRPIKLISWDGERSGLLGSTDYAEAHTAILRRRALVYLNLDNAISGTNFHCKANPLLQNVIYEAAKLTEFNGHEDWSLYHHWKHTSNATISLLDGLSSYTSFQYHLGVPAAQFQFNANDTSGAIYHSNSAFDSPAWLEKFTSSDYKLHNTMAMFVGLTTLMLSENELARFNTHVYLKKIYNWYVAWYSDLSSAFPQDYEVNRLAKRVLDLLKVTTWEDSVQFDQQNDILYKECREALPVWAFYKKIKSYIKLQRSNSKSKQIDQLFITHRGLKDREWMKYSLLAPSKLQGSVGEVLPGLHEGLADIDRNEVIQWLSVLLSQFSNVRYLLQ
ncbi:BBM_1a_G0030690.mRNA.1.CDS.1 [Saccharomyces cerevisiae]|nr:BBM_1a_G0030690.mRNA.1.CDS.1 [Saccharomyces cerevisiae]CAI7186226.1 BBM_1a_G0030690.mRNA.1.CDS.1 [Saccharomyces cerevisiae]